MARPEINELTRDQMFERAFDKETGFLYVALTNAFGGACIIDDSGNALVGMDFWSHKIHAGKFYQTSAVDLSMNINDTLVLAFKTPVGENQAHLAIDFVTNGDAHLDLIEGGDWDDESGSLMPIRNRLTIGAEQSDLLEDVGQTSFEETGNLILNPDNLTGGTILDTQYTFTPVPRGEGGDMGQREWVLQPDTQYAVRVTSDVNNNKCQLKLNWYEHVNIN